MDKSHYHILINLQQAWPQILQALKPTWKQFLDEQGSTLQHFNLASLQFIPDKDPTHGHYLSLVLQHSQQAEKPTTVTQEKLPPSLHPFKADASIITKPFVLPTHKPEGFLVIFQDALNQVYCLDRKGKLLWKKALKSPLVGDIFAIDFYKNNRWQYLWTTHDAVYLMDYHGKPVSNYPHKLPEAAVPMQLNVVDYLKDKNYRFLLAGHTGNIYLRDSHYRPLPGWNPKALDHPFASTPCHIHVKGDYFLALQANGKLQALNRKGQAYPGFPVDLTAAIHQPLVVKKGHTASNTLLVTLTDTGQLNHHNLAGILQKTIELDKPTANTQFSLCLEESIGQDDMILRQDLHQFAVLNEAGQVLFEKEHQAAQPLLGQYYDFGTHQCYVITDPGQHETYIYDAKGHALNTVPLPNSQLVKLHFTKGTSQLVVYSNFKDQALQYLLSF